MIVAYDLRYAGDHFAGIGKHAYMLLVELLDLPGDERYRVLWDPRESNSRHDLEVVRRHPRVEWTERPWHAVRPSGALAVGAWLRRTRPSVYFSPFGLRPFFSGVPEVLMLHDVAAAKVAHIPSRFSYLLYRLSLLDTARARAIVTVSEFSRREIIELLPVAPERVHAVLEGVPRRHGAEVRPVRPPQLTCDRFALVVGDNRPRKNVDVLARAWDLGEHSPDLDLVAVGPIDSRFPTVPTRPCRPGRAGVQHLGWVSPEELAWLYANARVVLLPSRYEGFGFPLVEAMTAGTPAVVSDIPVFREVGAGAPLFADVDDPRAWAREVIRLESDPGLRADCSERGRRRAAELTYRRTAEGTLDVLRLVARRP